MVTAGAAARAAPGHVEAIRLTFAALHFLHSPRALLLLNINAVIYTYILCYLRSLPWYWRVQNSSHALGGLGLRYS